MILKITLEGKSMIIVNCYLSPGDKTTPLGLNATLDVLNQRYSNTPIIIFGDFNCNREEAEKRHANVTQLGYKLIYDEDKEAFTRSETRKKKEIKSYLDYFMVRHLTDFDFSINNPIGNSDHRCLSLEIFQENMRIQRRTIKQHKFSMVNKKHEEIGKQLLNALKEPDNISKCTELVESLRGHFPLRKLKLKSHFRIIEQLSGVKNWDSIKSIIKNCNTENYCQYMASLEKLNTTRNWKEFFARIRFYSDLNKDVDILSNLSITLPDESKIVTIDRETINANVCEKYRKLFKDEGRKVVIKPINGEMFEYTNDVVLRALTKLNLKKATSWDLLPGKSFEIFKDTENLPHLVRFINKLMNSDKIPDTLSLGRLLCLNKNAQEPGHVDSIRPIVILGVIIKICEFSLLEELRKIRLNINQIGFLRRLGCKVSIARFTQIMHDLKYKD